MKRVRKEYMNTQRDKYWKRREETKSGLSKRLWSKETKRLRMEEGEQRRETLSELGRDDE